MSTNWQSRMNNVDDRVRPLGTSGRPGRKPSLPRMPGDATQQRLLEVARALDERAEDLASQVAKAISQEVGAYQDDLVPFDVLERSCAANMKPIVSAIAEPAGIALTAATELGVARARDGVPLASLMESYRVGVREVWAAAVEEASKLTPANGALVRELTAKILAAQDVLVNAMASAYRTERNRLQLRNQVEQSALIDSVLQARPFDDWSVWEAAELLCLPSDGPFVVIAAEVERHGSAALPGIESKLRCMDVFSAWRLLPDLEVGLVHVHDDGHLDGVLGLVSRMATARVGVSERFDDLRQAAFALRHARVTLRGNPDPGVNVTVFDGSILATAAVSTPELMVKLVAPVIECFDELTPSERDVLFDTFRIWRDNDGSLRSAGEILFCHPNTVRYRLHRIEQRTGRSLTRPRDVAELSLALEVHHRLMRHGDHRGRQDPGS